MGPSRFLAIVTIALFASLAVAQGVPPLPVPSAANAKPRLTFEVASVKAVTAADKRTRFEVAPDGAVDLNTDLFFLLFAAYHVKDFQVIGFPKALESASYRIVAKPPQGSPAVDQSTRTAQLAERLQSLLEDRFHLQVHHETRELLVYELIVAKGGSKLKVAQGDPANFKLRMPKGRILADGGSMAMLASVLANHFNRPVTDKTGLTGRYAIDLQFASDDNPDDPHPSLFTALQEQLGLKLESRKAPSEVLVIDHLERPSEN
jgi:uncharacterized protein (TIGR03435 family)